MIAVTHDIRVSAPPPPPPRALPQHGGDDAELVRRFASGDGAAFDILVARHQGRIAHLAHRLLGWTHHGGDVDDVVQEVFLAVFRQLGRFKGNSSFSTWLTVITINACRSHRRRWLTRWRALRRLRPSSPPSDVPAADDGALRDETSARVRAAVQSLPPRDREVIVLHYLERHDVAAMAGLLGLGRNAVEVRLHRARQRLRALLGGLVDEV